MILPWFGGVAAVWTVCLVFFQVCYSLDISTRTCLPRDSRRASRPGFMRRRGSEFTGASNSAEEFAETDGTKRRYGTSW